YIFNNEEDKKLDEKFGKETYEDELVLGATPTPTSTPTPTPTPTISIAKIYTRQQCYANKGCEVVAEGNNLNLVTIAYAVDSKGDKIANTNVFESSPTILYIYFGQDLGSGIFYLNLNDTVSSSTTFSVR
ncbi:MAG: hypothetical protein UW21_C0011G0009, partial [Candidatus Woesebacteria bacterium GW2011_GWB1_44_11b]